jgi:hypothetical protein
VSGVLVKEFFTGWSSLNALLFTEGGSGLCVGDAMFTASDDWPLQSPRSPAEPIVNKSSLCWAPLHCNITAPSSPWNYRSICMTVQTFCDILTSVLSRLSSA